MRRKLQLDVHGRKCGLVPDENKLRRRSWPGNLIVISVRSGMRSFVRNEGMLGPLRFTRDCGFAPASDLLLNFRTLNYVRNCIETCSDHQPSLRL